MITTATQQQRAARERNWLRLRVLGAASISFGDGLGNDDDDADLQIAIAALRRICTRYNARNRRDDAHDA